MKQFKKNKQFEILQKEGIPLTTEPSKVLILKNGGIMNGFTRASLFEFFSLSLSDSALPVEIEMPAAKAFSILKFSSASDSQKFWETFDGVSAPTGGREPRKTWYCFFTNEEWTIPEESGASGVFGCKSLWPSGMEIVEDFISKESEKLLIELALCYVSAEENENSYNENSETLKHRKVVHFGFCFNYDTNGVYSLDSKKAPKIPQECLDILKPLVDAKKIKEMPDQVTINIYEPGQGIPSHVDTHSVFAETLISLSLGSPIVMEMKMESGNGLGSHDLPLKVPVLLPPRSLTIFEGDSRYGWKHGIASKKIDVFENLVSGRTENFERSRRVSYTYRKLRQPPFCNCRFPRLCDYRNFGIREKKLESDIIKIPQTKEDAVLIEAEFVQEVYDQIADHFSSTRHTAWPKVKKFLEEIPSGSFVLDLGCGNGKYLFQQKSVFKIGIDNSVGLTHICSERGFEVMVSDCLSCPIRSSCADFIISIAVIHHLSIEDRRLKAIAEIVRLLKPGGKALIYVWAMEQKHQNVKSHYVSKKNSSSVIPEVEIGKGNQNKETTNLESDEVTRDENGQNIEFISRHVNRTPFTQQDLFVPWQMRNKPSKTADAAKKENEAKCGEAVSKGDTFYRFYHVFRSGELENLCLRASDQISIVDSYFDDGNWCVVVQKSDSYFCFSLVQAKVIFDRR